MKAGSFVVLLDDQVVWIENDTWQTRGTAMERTHNLVKLLQRAFDAGVDQALNSDAGF